VGKFLEMRTNGVLYWENGQVWTSSNLTNLNQLSNGPGYITSSALGSYLPLSGGTMTGDLRFNQGAGFGRIAYADNYHGMIIRGIPSDAAGNVTVGDFTSLIQHSGDFRFYRTNGSINELYFQVNATAPYWRGNVILHASNYNSYSPTLTGGNASGTWGINITGNANNITQYTINQSLGTGNSPTFSNIYANGEVAAYGFRYQNGYATTYCGFGGGGLYNGYHIESSWGNLRHGDLSNYEVSADGSSWSAGTIDANIYNLFLGEKDKGGNLTIEASGVGRYKRFTFAIGYKNFDMLHITGSTNGEQIYIKLEVSTDSGSNYTEHFTSIWSSWPGNHTKFWSIFNSSINRLRLTIYKPGNNYSNSASINSINYYGGYAGYNERYHMQVYNYDYQTANISRNTTVGGSLSVSGNQSWFNGQTSQINLENQSSFARFAFNDLRFYDWNNGQDVMTIDGGYVSAANSFRAPIFYDSNDTSYYLDPNSVSYVYEHRTAWRHLIGEQSYDSTLFDGGTSQRPAVVIRGAYPHLELISSNYK